MKEEENGFLFNPENVDNMVAAICKISALSEEDRQQMGQRNRQLCMDRNTEEAFLNAYVELINKM